MVDFVVQVDLPAHNVDDDANSILASENLADTSTATELVLVGSAQPLSIHHYGPGSTGNIALPSIPPGVTLAGATYVVIAYAESTDTGSLTGWSPDTPDPTQLPFLMIETSADGYNRTLDPVPVGAYGAETVWPGDDSGAIMAGLPANRIWLQSPHDVHIHVAYAAVRLTYTLDSGLLATGWSVG